jgi:hypothetical protein
MGYYEDLRKKFKATGTTPGIERYRSSRAMPDISESLSSIRNMHQRRAETIARRPESLDQPLTRRALAEKPEIEKPQIGPTYNPAALGVGLATLLTNARSNKNIFDEKEGEQIKEKISKVQTVSESVFGQPELDIGEIKIGEVYDGNEESRKQESVFKNLPKPTAQTESIGLELEAIKLNREREEQEAEWAKRLEGYKAPDITFESATDPENIKNISKQWRGEDGPGATLNTLEKGIAAAAAGVRSIDASLSKVAELGATGLEKINRSVVKAFDFLRTDEQKQKIDKQLENSIYGKAAKYFEGQVKKYEAEADYARGLYESAEGAEKFVLDAVSATAEMLPAIAIAVMTSGASAGPTMGGTALKTGTKMFSTQSMKEMLGFGIQAAGAHARDAEKQGYDYDKQVLYGVTGGLVEMATEVIPFSMIKKFTGISPTKLIMKTGANNFATRFGKKGLQWLSMAGTNMAQEVAVDPIMKTVEMGIENKSLPIYGKGAIIDPEVAKQSASGALGVSLFFMPFGVNAQASEQIIADAIEENRPLTKKEVSTIKLDLQQFAGKKDIGGPDITPAQFAENLSKQVGKKGLAPELPTAPADFEVGVEATPQVGEELIVEEPAIDIGKEKKASKTTAEKAVTKATADPVYAALAVTDTTKKAETALAQLKKEGNLKEYAELKTEFDKFAPKAKKAKQTLRDIEHEYTQSLGTKSFYNDFVKQASKSDFKVYKEIVALENKLKLKELDVNGRQKLFDLRKSFKEKALDKKYVDFWKTTLAKRDAQIKKDETKRRKKLFNDIAELKNNKKLAPEVRKMVDETFGDIDTTAMSMRTATKNKLLALETQYKDVFMPPDIQERISRLDQRNIKSLDNETVLAMSDAVATIKHQQAVKDKLVFENKIETMPPTIDKITDDIGPERFKDAKIEPFHEYVFKNQALIPEDMALSVVGWNEDSPFYKIVYRDMTDGMLKAIDKQFEFEDFITESESRYNIKRKELREPKPVKVGADTINMTRAEMMSVYLHSLNDSNKASLMDGGGRTSRQTKTKVYTESDINDVVSQLTDNELAFANELNYFFENYTKPAINETSVKVDGYEIANVPNYFTKENDTQYAQVGFNKFLGRGTIEGRKIFQERMEATNSIMIEDVFDVVDRVSKHVADYYGYALPLRNAKLVINNPKIKTAIKGRFGRGVRVPVEGGRAKPGIAPQIKYFQDLYAQIEGNRNRDNNRFMQLISAGVNNLQTAVIAANPKVWLAQTGSFGNMLSELDLKYAIEGLKGKVKDSTMYDNSGFLRQRYKKFAVSRDIGEVAQRNKIGQKLALPTTYFDKTVIKRIWNGYEAQVKAENPEIKVGSDEFYNKVARLTENNIFRTQPNFNLMQRSALSRETNPFLRALTMFKSQSTSNYNGMLRGINEIKKGNYKKGFQRIAGIVIGTMTYAALSTSASKWREYDDVEFEKELLSAFVNQLYGISNLYNWFVQGYEAGNPFDIQLRRIAGSIKDIGNANSLNTVAGKVKSVTENMAQIFGIPAKNVVRELSLIYKNLFGSMAKYDFDSLFKKTPYFRHIADSKQEESYDKTKELVNRFTKDSMSILNISPKSNAMYNYKKAVRANDKEAQKRFLTDYFKLGGSISGMESSMRSLNPLNALKPAEKVKFKQGLSSKDRKTVNEGIEYYNKLFDSGLKLEPTEEIKGLEMAVGKIELIEKMLYNLTSKENVELKEEYAKIKLILAKDADKFIDTRATAEMNITKLAKAREKLEKELQKQNLNLLNEKMK